MNRKSVQSLFDKMSAAADALQRRRLKHLTETGSVDAREAERLGEAERARPAGPLIWVHGADPDQLASILSLMPRLEIERGESLAVLVTTPLSVPPGRLPNSAIHQLAPVDTAPAVERFLNHWHPDIAIFCGDAMHGSAIRACASRNTPVVWTEARHQKALVPAMSRASKSTMMQFSRIFALSDEDAKEIIGAGIDPGRVIETGPLQEEAVALPCDEAERDRMALAFAARPVWLAVAVRPADIEAIDAAHRHVARRSHRMLLILVPAAPEDAPAMAAELSRRGWDIVLRSDKEDPAPDTQILIADMPDEDGLWYRLAPLSFFGGTFSEDQTTRNPLEAAALGSAVIHGPLVSVNRSRFDRLARAGASRLVQAPEGLGVVLESLLAPDKVAVMAEAAWRVASDGAEAADDVVMAVAELLDERDLSL
jgi:3-deoxy-D-manno-octulosonic-acid transferase